ncbi:MAG: Uma2 family endonuclease [Aridibacter sp.]
MSAVLEQIKDETMTTDEFFDSPFARGFELVQGKVVPKGGNIDFDMPTGALHGAVTEELASRMSWFVKKHNAGRIFAAETGFILNEGTVRGIDIAFVGNEKLKEHGIPEKYFPVAPDIAVEVISPGNTFDEIQDKIIEYLAAGTELIWIIYPKQKMVQVHKKSNVIQVLREKDELSGEDILPDFNIKLEEIFNL